MVRTAMNLRMNNFAKIEQIDIKLDGITVLVGENNTGKSTAGKALFSIFNALEDVENKIKKQRMNEMGETCRSVIQEYASDMNNSERRVNARRYRFYSCSEKISEDCMNQYWKTGNFAENQVLPLITKDLEQCWDIERMESGEAKLQELAKQIYDAFVPMIELPEKEILKEVITRYFQQVFHGQINSLCGEEKEASIELLIKGKTVKARFRENECFDFFSEVQLLHQVIYIDNPFVMDELNGGGSINVTERHLIKLLMKEDGDIMDGIVGSVIAKERIDMVYQLLSGVVDGDIVRTNQDEYYIKTELLRDSLSTKNLSTGMKSFVILKLLLKKGLIKEQDILVLDEPEIHLHPQWQIVYAELIVLLQKEFNLTVVVVTHSPYFMDAIDLYSRKYKTKNRVNYYLAEAGMQGATMECVTDNLEQAYDKMVSPIDILETLRNELNNQSE
jgi:predicted ATPase